MTFAKHKTMKDVCLQILDSAKRKDAMRIKGMWINIANGDPFIIMNRSGPCVEEFTIPIEIWANEWLISQECFPYARTKNA